MITAYQQEEAHLNKLMDIAAEEIEICGNCPYDYCIYDFDYPSDGFCPRLYPKTKFGKRDLLKIEAHIKPGTTVGELVAAVKVPQVLIPRLIRSNIIKVADPYPACRNKDKLVVGIAWGDDDVQP